MATISSYRCGCIVLAAGASRRLGRPKQLLSLNGQTLIRRAVSAALEAGFSPVLAVLGANAALIANELNGVPVRIVFNPDWHSGMSTSLHQGLASIVSEDPDISHVVVMVCDQVHVGADTLIQLLHHSMADPDVIVATAYSSVSGVPAIFPRAFFSDLLATEGDRGARGLLERLGDQVSTVAFVGASLDIDTAEDAVRAGLV